jgi:spore germination cell wall hydrolase CwlJ-like protein
VKQGYSKGKHKCQFSWYCDGKSDTPYEKKAWALSQIIAQDVLDGTVPDNTGGATHYHAHYVKPFWAKALTETVSLKTHKYYK